MTAQDDTPVEALADARWCGTLTHDGVAHDVAVDADGNPQVWVNGAWQPATHFSIHVLRAWAMSERVARKEAETLVRLVREPAQGLRRNPHELATWLPALLRATEVVGLGYLPANGAVIRLISRKAPEPKREAVHRALVQAAESFGCDNMSYGPQASSLRALALEAIPRHETRFYASGSPRKYILMRCGAGTLPTEGEAVEGLDYVERPWIRAALLAYDMTLVGRVGGVDDYGEWIDGRPAGEVDRYGKWSSTEVYVPEVCL